MKIPQVKNGSFNYFVDCFMKETIWDGGINQLL